MIHEYNNAAQTKWNRGEYQVELRTPANSRPMGYCDGTDQDEQELRDIGESEGVDVTIHKKLLKTGRQIWTISA